MPESAAGTQDAAVIQARTDRRLQTIAISTPSSQSHRQRG